jgi:hypothetical protein
MNNSGRLSRICRQTCAARTAWTLARRAQYEYAISQRCRKRIEEVFGWTKNSAGLRKVKLRGRARVDAVFTMALAAYNLIRLPKLLEAAA